MLLYLALNFSLLNYCYYIFPITSLSIINEIWLKAIFKISTLLKIKVNSILKAISFIKLINLMPIKQLKGINIYNS